MEPITNDELQMCAKASLLARIAHASQTEKYGRKRPYVEHLAAVVRLINYETCERVGVSYTETRAVAWLHDICEDTPCAPSDLHCCFGFPVGVATAVALLTRSKTEATAYDGYYAYIMKIAMSGNAMAVLVKLADLDDHLAMVDGKYLCPERLVSRYLFARTILEQAKLEFVDYAEGVIR